MHWKLADVQFVRKISLSLKSARTTLKCLVWGIWPLFLHFFFFFTIHLQQKNVFNFKKKKKNEAVDGDFSRIILVTTIYSPKQYEGMIQ